MGNRDRRGKNDKKPKKKDPGVAKPLAATTLITSSPTPQLVRKKKRQEASE